MVKVKVKVNIGSWGPPTDAIKQYEEMVAKKLQIEEALKAAQQNEININEFKKQIDNFLIDIENAKQYVDNIGNHVLSLSVLLGETEEEVTENTQCRHIHSNADVLNEFGENTEGKPTYKGEVLGSSETSERPTETKIFLNDFSYEPNMDASSVVGDRIYITALRDEQNDLSGKEVKKIEYSINGEWVDIRDLISKYPTHPYAINMNRSFRYSDVMHEDTVCFAVIGYVVTGGNEFIQEISNSNQDGFRVTYYTD